MAIINNAADGFPIDKVREAVSYISALKPHWSPMSDGTSIVPSSTNTLPGEQFGAITSTDKEGNIYVDRSFALSSSVPEIAAAIEFQYQLHLRNMWERMSWVPEDQWHDVVPMAMSLEINSAIESEYQRISPAGRVSENFLIKAGLTAAEVRRYQLGKMPNIRAIGGFFPDELGLEPGMTAENYAKIILDAMQSQDVIDPGSEESGDDDERDPEESPQEGQETPQDEQNEEGEDSGSGEDDMASGNASDDSEDDSNDTADDSQDGCPDSQEQQESDGEYENDTTGEDGNDADGSDQEGSDSDDASGQEEGQGLGNPSDHDSGEQGSPDEDSGSDGSDADEDSDDASSNADGEGSNDANREGSSGTDPRDSGEHADDDNSSNGSDGESQASSGDSGQDGDSGNSDSDDGDGEHPSEGSSSDTGSADYLPSTMKNGTSLDEARGIMDRIDERMDDPSSSMWQNSIHNPNDSLDVNPMKPDSMQFEEDSGNGECQLEDALDEVYENLVASSKDPGIFSGDVKDVMLSSAISSMKRKKADFVSRQRRVTVSAVQSARMAGATDMSLAVRNPNQPMLGPIMPGTFDYSPRIYCIQDVSGSMMGAYTIAAGKVFQDVVTDVASNFNAKTLWIAVDFAVRSISETSRWGDSKIWGTMHYGGGVTDISSIAVAVSLGKLICEGRRYPEPDVLCILTDGKFKWPDRRPRVKTKWIVTTFKSCLKNLPDWLRKDEVVTID